MKIFPQERIEKILGNVEVPCKRLGSLFKTNFKTMLEQANDSVSAATKLVVLSVFTYFGH